MTKTINGFKVHLVGIPPDSINNQEIYINKNTLIRFCCYHIRCEESNCPFSYHDGKKNSCAISRIPQDRNTLKAKQVLGLKILKPRKPNDKSN